VGKQVGIELCLLAEKNLVHTYLWMAKVFTLKVKRRATPAMRTLCSPIGDFEPQGWGDPYSSFIK